MKIQQCRTIIAGKSYFQSSKNTVEHAFKICLFINAIFTKPEKPKPDVDENIA